MFPFYFIFVCLFLCAMMDTINLVEKQRNMLFFFVFLFLALFAGLRFSSPDYGNYVSLFKSLNKLHVNGDVPKVANDSGFYLLNKIIGFFTTSHVAFFVVVAFLSVGINLSCYKKYTPYFFTATILYFAHTYLSRELMQIRAGLACAICLYSVRFIVEKRFKPFLVFILLSASIHLAAISFICSYFLCKLSISAKAWTKIIFICLIVGVFCPLGQFIKLMPNIELLERMQIYSNWETYSSGLGVFSNITVLKSLFIGLFCLYNYKKLNYNYAFTAILDIYLFSLCWLVVFNDFNIIAGRIATFFSIGEVVLCASFYSLFKQRSKYICAFALCTFAYLMLALNISIGRLFEYKLVSLLF